MGKIYKASGVDENIVRGRGKEYELCTQLSVWDKVEDKKEIKSKWMKIKVLCCKTVGFLSHLSFVCL